MNHFKVILAAAFIAGTGVAVAAQHTISQKGKVFSETEITIKKGESLVFLNDDNVTHNVMSNTPGNEFNLGPIAPGHSTPVTFNSAGQVNVICAIHPTMKMVVKVTD